MREAWEGGRSVPESSAGDAAVVQRAPVEHQDGPLPRRGGAAYTCDVEVDLQVKHAPFSRGCG